MKYLIATCDRHLGLCLRMLKTQEIKFVVEVDRNDKGKYIFKIGVKANKETFKEVSKLYDGLIS
ncbi:MAG: hypothetical protein NC078_08025 [Ruminococcus sp.]|nr:hypothetical protein [Ruminococcus sp.]